MNNRKVYLFMLDFFFFFDSMKSTFFFNCLIQTSFLVLRVWINECQLYVVLLIYVYINKLPLNIWYIKWYKHCLKQWMGCQKVFVKNFLLSPRSFPLSKAVIKRKYLFIEMVLCYCWKNLHSYLCITTKHTILEFINKREVFSVIIK